MHVTLILSFELFVLVAALFLYVYISKQEMAKAYRYFAGTIAVIMIIFFIHTMVSHIMHRSCSGYGGHGYEQCGGGHHEGSSYHRSGAYHGSADSYGCGHGCGGECRKHSKSGYHGKCQHHGAKGKHKRIEKTIIVEKGELTDTVTIVE